MKCGFMKNCGLTLAGWNADYKNGKIPASRSIADIELMSIHEYTLKYPNIPKSVTFLMNLCCFLVT